jgi:hypothetical protein
MWLVDSAGSQPPTAASYPELPEELGTTVLIVIIVLVRMMLRRR